MTSVAAIDVGSNAIRLAVVSLDNEGRRETVHTSREAVRLGKDVFSIGRISDETMDRALEAFERLREQIDRFGAVTVRAAATSAVREAANRDLFVASVAGRCRIPLVVIGPEEEARLVHLAVKERISLKNRVALLIDIGGGSVEVSIATQTGILSTESYAMGSVRLLETLKHERLGERRFNRLMERYVESIERRLKRELGNQTVDCCIGAGGSIESLGALRRDLLGKSNTSKVAIDDLATIIKELEKMEVADRIAQLRLRPDRADVIVPAAIVLHKILRVAGVDEVAIPGVSLKDGLISEMVSEELSHETRLDYDQIIASALALGRKYAFDEPHARAVADLALQIFDQTRAALDYPFEKDSRTLLEVAALLHDIGQFVNVSNHHKHTLYLLQASSVIGLTSAQMEVVANVARYHRKSAPKPQHRNYEQLSARQRTNVAGLAAILRLANALDRERAGAVRSVEIAFKKPKFIMKLLGEGEMLLERWALSEQRDLFENVFGVKLVVEGSES
ncbi:MAG TPA: Ppx/GppA phosphatase family protein [Terriglobia bacterium]|nr:Ppx/GppA phosphatase family protein [Terriglobia bacterium]